MTNDEILKAVPGADDEFVRTICQLPEPSEDIRDKFFAELPNLHIFFLDLKEALKNGDDIKLRIAAQKQLALLENAEKASL